MLHLQSYTSHILQYEQTVQVVDLWQRYYLVVLIKSFKSSLNTIKHYIFLIQDFHIAAKIVKLSHNWILKYSASFPKNLLQSIHTSAVDH